MSNIQARLGTVIVMLFLAIGFGLAFSAKADEICKTPEALSHLANIKKNQPRIAETRPARDRVASAFNTEQEINPDDVEGYNEFIRNKAWNAGESKALHDLGCMVDWSTLELVPFPNGEQ